MSDPGLLAAKLAAVEVAIREYVNGISVSYLGMNITVGDHVSAEQVKELSAIVVDTVDTAEDAWAAGHPTKKP